MRGFSLSDDQGELFEQRQVRMVRRVTWIGLGITWAVLFSILATASWRGILGVVCSILCFTLLLQIVERGSSRRAAWYLLVVVWITAFDGAISTGGLGTVAFSWLIAVPMIGGLVVNRQGAVVGGVLSGSSMVALVVAEYQGVSFLGKYLGKDLLIQNLLDSLGIMIAVGMTIWFFLSERRWAEGLLRQGIRELEREVEDRTQAEQQARKAEQARTRFLAMVSHELRTPLNGVLGLTQLLSAEDLASTPRAYVHDIDRSARHLLALVEQILDFAAAEVGPSSERQQVFDLRSVLEDVMVTLAGQADSGVEVRLEVPETFHALRLGNRQRLAQLFLNLGGNALKFTPEGEVVLGCTEGEDDWVECFVRDTGVGLPEEVGQELFEPFVQGQVEIAGARRGLGLGLAIVKQVVEALGGEVSFAPGPEGGTIFRFRLPLPRAEEEGVALPEAPSESLFSGRVLVIEDDPVSRLVACRMLENMGLEVLSVDDGTTGFETLRNGPFDLALVDGNLPGLSGVEIARRIRREGQRMPLVGLTADAMPGDRKRYLEAGMDAYLTKPLDREELVDILGRWLPAGSP